MIKDTCIYGMHAITEAIKAGKQIDKIVVRRGQDNPLTREMLSEARKLDIPIQFVPIEKIDWLKNSLELYKDSQKWVDFRDVTKAYLQN